jgi:hypothetical protein
MEKILRLLVEDENIEQQIRVGLSFENQINGSDSRPDGCIIQNPINIFIEAKLGNDLSVEQINRHIESIKNTKDIFGKKYLICLTRDNINKLDGIINADNIIIIYKTYKEIVEILEKEIKDWESDIIEMLEDYKDILGDLIVNQDFIMFTSPCNATINLNQKYGVYYDSFDRPKRNIANFIGLYADKAIKYIGKIDAVITFGEGFDYEAERGILKEEYKQSIQNIIKESQTATNYGDISERRHRFFITEQFVQTNFIKTTKGGLLGLKYFDLAKYKVTKDDNIEVIAGKINNNEWGE